MRAVFFGTPPHAVPTLAALCQVADVALVVTQPDRPRGRSRHPIAPAVKEAAADWTIPVAQPERAGELTGRIGELQVDVAVVVAFGQLIPARLLEVPSAGFLNLHFSLLPRWRGASPVVRAILAGDAVTGVTLMQMDASLDTGPILATAETAIASDETAGRLTGRLAGLAAALVADRLEDVVAGRVEPREQDESGATAAAMVRVEEAFVDPRRHSATSIDRAVRAFDPRPGAWSIVEGRRLKLWRVRPCAAAGPEPGLVDEIDGRVLLGARDGTLEVLELQPEGRPRMAAADWLRGRRGEPARLEPPASP